MRKIQFTTGPEIGTAAEPVPGPGELLVRVQLAGVPLALVRMLHAGNNSEAGGEVVGTVTAVGDGLSDEWIGKRVGGIAFTGIYAEYVLALPGLVTEVPATAAAADALAVVRGGLVGLSALRAAWPAPGESVLVTAAASGAGHLVVQLAKALGAGRVVAAASSADKAEFLRACGADATLTYAEPWAERFDIVIDGVGGEFVQRGADALAPHGRLVAYSAGGGSVDAGTLLADLKTITGFSMGLLARTRPELLEQYRTELWKLLADGMIRPHCTVYAFEEIGAALETVETRRNLGRVALLVG